MKINKMLIAVLAMLAVVLSSCKDDDPTVGIDSGMPAPAVFYDAVNSVGKTIAVYWNPTQAISAGATSFTVQLVKSETSEGDVYDNTISQTLASIDNDGQPSGMARFDNLAKGRIFYVRVRANYPRSVYSPWILAAASEEDSTPARIKVGEGLVGPEIGESSDIETRFIGSTESSVSIAWSTCDTWTANDLDKGLPYRLELFADDKCTDLVVAWNASANLADATSTSNAVFKLGTRFSFSNLDPETSYWARVTNTADNVVSEPVECKTGKSNYKAMPAAATVGEIILFQDFHEIVYGGNPIDAAAGVSTTKKGKGEQFWPLRGDDPTKDTEKGLVLCSGDREIGLFNTLKSSVAASTTLQDWGRMYEDESTTSKENGAICARQGLLKMGAGSYRGCVVTPELKCLTQPATIELSFKASAFDGGDENQTILVHLLDDTKIDGSYWVTAASKTQVGTGATGTKADGWKDFTFTIENVTATSRIAIGGENGGGSVQHRFLLDDIQIKLISYGELSAPDAPAKPELTATDRAITVKWEQVARADGYKVEYKESSAADWTASEKTNELTYTIEGLKFETAYDVRVVALLGELASEPSEVAQITTLAEIKQLATPQNVTAEADYGVATLTFDPVVGATGYEVYANGSPEKLVGMVTSAADAAKVTYKVTGLAFNTAYTFQVKAVADGITASELSVATESATTTSIYQIKNNVGPTIACIGWGDYKDKVKTKFMIQIADKDGKTLGTIDLTNGKYDGTAATINNAVRPTRFTFGALTPATTYKVRLKEVGEDDLIYSPYFEFTTEAAHVKSAKEVLYQSFDESWYGGDYMNSSAGMGPTSAYVTNPVLTWEGYIANQTVLDLATNTNVSASKLPKTFSTLETTSFYGYTFTNMDMRPSHVKLGGSSAPGVVITAALGEGVLNATTAIPCTISFKVAPLSDATKCEAKAKIIVVHADGSETVAIDNIDVLTDNDPYLYVWKEASVSGVNLLSTDKLKITSDETKTGDKADNRCRFCFDDLLVVAE